MIPDEKEYTRLLNELNFMYIKYQELCAAYKKLALGKLGDTTTHDQSHMNFEDEGENRYV
jgi:hypothetical protein